MTPKFCLMMEISHHLKLLYYAVFLVYDILNLILCFQTVYNGNLIGNVNKHLISGYHDFLYFTCHVMVSRFHRTHNTSSVAGLVLQGGFGVNIL